MLTRRSMQSLVDEVREDLDEPYAAPPDTTNFWSQDYIVGRINFALRRIWQLARNDKGSEWFVRRLRSDDPPVTIYGQPYNPEAFQASTGKTELILPPDLGELLHLEPVINTTTLQAADVRFAWGVGLNDVGYRELSRGTTVGFAEYRAVLVQRLDGPRLVFTPPFADLTTDFQMEYVAKPDNYALTDTFEGLGFDDLFLDAVRALAALRCLDKSDNPNPDKVQLLTNNWNETRAMVTETISPLQTVEHEFVSNFLPDDGGW
jgi:hypothetical protein